jgi:hypothetical protein
VTSWGVANQFGRAVTTGERRWPRRHITGGKAQRALDALMALVQTCDWADVDADDKAAIHGACSALTRMRDAAKT